MSAGYLDTRKTRTRFDVKRHRLSLHMMWLALLVLAGPAHAVQHLIQPGARWDMEPGELRAGDEILLMPGQHRPATIEAAIGSATGPITIKSMDASRPAQIEATRNGIHLLRCRNVVIENVIIISPRQYGVRIDDGDDQSVPPWLSDNPSGGHKLRHVMIVRTGTESRHHAVMIQAQDGVSIQQCAFQGWGGSAVWVAHSKDVVIEQCQLRRLQGFNHEFGIYVCGASEDVRIARNYMDDPGKYAVKVGDRFRADEFGTINLAKAEKGSLFDARRVVIEHNVIAGTECAISLSHVERCHVRSNTLVSPRQIAFSLMHNHVDRRFGGHSRNTLANNLIVSEYAPAPRAVVVLKPLTREQVTLGVNVWWSPDMETWRPTLETIPVDDSAVQLVTIDPSLDHTFRPRHEDVMMFGAQTDDIPIPAAKTAKGSP
ncbi:MAG: right-handed parallel beta-helix repeat-containing protein [Planctomycetota bacterium]